MKWFEISQREGEDPRPIELEMEMNEQVARPKSIEHPK